jgi:PIN domain nuclease of toxin-antitoxin system
MQPKCLLDQTHLLAEVDLKQGIEQLLPVIRTARMSALTLVHRRFHILVESFQFITQTITVFVSSSKHIEEDWQYWTPIGQVLVVQVFQAIID